MSIDVVQALDLLEHCAEQAASGSSEWPRQPVSCDVADLTLGARIALRAADRSGRAGASATRALDAAYAAVQRYVELLPDLARAGSGAPPPR